MELLKLDDGRDLEIYVSGPPAAPPLVFHHGTPGAATPLIPLERAAHSAGLRFISFSRPGYGRSTRRPGRVASDAWIDVAQIVSALDVDRFVTAGWSGGAPHALATAAAMPERVAGTLVISGAGAYGVEDLNWLEGMGEQNVESALVAASGDEATLRSSLEAEVDPILAADAESVLDVMPTLLAGVDRRALNAGLADYLVTSMADGVRSGVDGWVDDHFVLFQPWQFLPESITRPVTIWHGGNDLMVPYAHGQWLATHVPGAKLHLKMREGHYSLLDSYAEEMVAELAATLALPTAGGAR